MFSSVGREPWIKTKLFFVPWLARGRAALSKKSQQTPSSDRDVTLLWITFIMQTKLESGTPRISSISARPCLACIVERNLPERYGEYAYQLSVTWVLRGIPSLSNSD